MRPRFLTSDRFRTLLFGLTEGALLAALVVNVRDAVREDQFFRDISVKAVEGATSAEDRLVALVHKTHRMVSDLRRGIEEGAIEDVSGLAHYRRILFHSALQDAVYPTNMCGSYSGLLVELLKSQGFPARFGQMLDRDDPNGIAHHIVVETRLDGRWVVCDAMYDLVFRDADGRILGFDEIRRDWDRLKAQCPPGYDMRYDYAGYRRVNFGRLNSWLQQTPLARIGVRSWLNEGAWLRSALVASLLALVAAIHVWYERTARAGGFANPQTAARAAVPRGGDAPEAGRAWSAHGSTGVSARR